MHRERGISVLYVTHDQEEALTMSDRIAVFDHGRIQQVGTPEELYDRPSTRFVASFIGDTNLIAGRAVATADGACEVDTPAGRVRVSVQRPILAGASVVVAVRPERVVLSTEGDGLAGVVTDVIFVGTARKYAVRLTDGTECFVLRQVGQPPIAERGASVKLSWDPAYATAFEN